MENILYILQFILMKHILFICEATLQKVLHTGNNFITSRFE